MLSAIVWELGTNQLPTTTQLHVPQEATLRTQNANSGLPVLILSGYEIGHGSHPSSLRRRADVRRLPQ